MRSAKLPDSSFNMEGTYYAPINVKPHPTQYGLCGALGGDLNLNFAPRGGEFEQALYSSIDPLQ